MPSPQPVARTADLILTEVADELLVLDQTTNQVHLLERDTASVWRAADGTRSVDELSVSSGLTTSEVTAILQELSAVNLLANPWSREDEPSSLLTRRQALKRVGLAAGLVSVVIPTAAAAQSAQVCVPFNQCSRQSWGRTCCNTGLICAHDLRDNWYACFAPVFCDDPDFWQVDCNLGAGLASPTTTARQQTQSRPSRPR